LHRGGGLGRRGDFGTGGSADNRRCRVGRMSVYL
jgi:hypothetical protein